jgi:hypothetical protein
LLHVEFSSDKSIACTNVTTFNEFNQGGISNYMNQSNSSPNNPSPSRVTLKLKAGARTSANESKSPPVLRQPSKVSQKPGAQWSDEYKRRMQADMDALMSR